MYNKQVLSEALANLQKRKAKLTQPKDIIVDPMGQYNHPGEVTRIPGGDITMANVPYPVMAYPNVGQPQMMYPEQNYNFPGADYVDEHPMMQGGGANTPEQWVSEIRDVEREIGSPDQWTLKGYNLLQNKLNSYKNWRETTPEGQAVYDSSNKAGEYNIPLPEHLQGATNTMMKARLAYANQFGNPAAKRMVVPTDNPYQFNNGNDGTHYMASMDNYAVPQIQDQDSKLVLGNYGPSSKEAMRFDSDEDAEYFAKNYKTIAPVFQKKYGGLVTGLRNTSGNLLMNKKGKRLMAQSGSLSATNELFLGNPLLTKRKKAVYVPGAAFQDGGPKDTIIYPPGDSEYMNQRPLNYDILEMLNQKARREYENYIRDLKNPNSINKTSPQFQQKFYIKEALGLQSAKYGGLVGDPPPRKILPTRYTDNPNDPGIQAYADSLNSWNRGVELLLSDPNISNAQEQITDGIFHPNIPLGPGSPSLEQYSSFLLPNSNSITFREPVQPVEYKEHKPNLDTDLAAWLKTQKSPATYTERKKLYEQATGLTDYKGTADQNIGLLNLLKEKGLDYKKEKRSNTDGDINIPGENTPFPNQPTGLGLTRTITRIPSPPAAEKQEPRPTGLTKQVPKTERVWSNSLQMYVPVTRAGQSASVESIGTDIGGRSLQNGGTIPKFQKTGEKKPLPKNSFLPTSSSFDLATLNRIYQDIKEQEKIQSLPEQQIYATPESRKKYEDVYAKAQSIAKAFPRAAEYFTKNKRYKNQGIEGISEYIQDITNYQKNAEDYYKARQAVKRNRMSTANFEKAYRERGWQQFDNKNVKTSEEDQKELEEIWYGPTDEQGRRYWMSNPMNVAKVAQGISTAAVLGPGAVASGVAAPVGYVLSNPLVQAGLTGYGVYDATTNTLPEAYRDFSEGRYLEGLGNVGMAALDLAPIPLFGTNLLGEASQVGKYLTQGPLKNAYKLNPRALKETPEVIMYRTQKPGQTEELMELKKLQQKRDTEGISSLSTKEKIDLSKLESRPGFGQGFDTEVDRIGYYGNPNIRNTRGYQETPEVLRVKVPREQAAGYNISNFPDYRKISTSPRTEHLLPNELIQSAEKFSFDDYARLMQEDKAFNTPHWLRGYGSTTPKQLPSSSVASSVDDVGRGLVQKSNQLPAPPNQIFIDNVSEIDNISNINIQKRGPKPKTNIYKKTETVSENGFDIKTRYRGNKDIPADITVTGKSGYWQLKPNKTAGKNTWYLSANMDNPLESGKAMLKIDDKFPFPKPAILEPNNLSLDSYNNLLKLGKKKDWTSTFENYIPLNYSSKNSKLLKDLNIENTPNTSIFKTSKEAKEVVNRVNKFLSEKEITQQARIFHNKSSNTFGVEIPNFKLQRAYSIGGIIATGAAASYKQGGIVLDLSEDEIRKYLEGGYVVEEL